MDQSFNGQTLLHIAASQGDLDRVKELCDQNPGIAEAVDSRGRLAIHLACAKGYTDIAKVLLSFGDLDMCSTRDSNGRNPLHLAAMNGRVEVLQELVNAYPAAAETRSDRGGTILHLCLKYNHMKALKLLRKKFQLGDLVDAKDDDGNTILHLTLADGDIVDLHFQIFNRLLACPKIEVNAMNSRGETPLDMAMAASSHETEDATLVVDALRNAGAKLGVEVRMIDWLTNKREALMVVASLIATMAFQAGISPPGGVWQDSADGHRAGETVMAYNYPGTFPSFLKSNTIGFVGSLSTILLLTSNLKFRKKKFVTVLVLTVWGTIIAMAVTYALGISVVTPKKDRGTLTTLRIVSTIWGIGMVMVQLIYTLGLIKSWIKEQKIKRSISKTKKRWAPFRLADLAAATV